MVHKIYGWCRSRRRRHVVYVERVYKTLKWWKKMFIYLLAVSYVNSWIMWKTLHHGTRQKREKFRVAGVHGLLDGYVKSNSRPGWRSIDQPRRLYGTPLPKVHQCNHISWASFKTWLCRVFQSQKWSDTKLNMHVKSVIYICAPLHVSTGITLSWITRQTAYQASTNKLWNQLNIQ